MNVNLAAGVATKLTGSFGAITTEVPMLAGEGGFTVVPLFTVGETLRGTTGALNPLAAGDYTPVGVPDGIGAFRLDASTVRVLINHELHSAAPYAVSDEKGGDRIDGGMGDDRLRGGAGGDEILGRDGDDRIIGEAVTETTVSLAETVVTT